MTDAHDLAVFDRAAAQLNARMRADVLERIPRVGPAIDANTTGADQDLAAPLFWPLTDLANRFPFNCAGFTHGDTLFGLLRMATLQALRRIGRDQGQMAHVDFSEAVEPKMSAHAGGSPLGSLGYQRSDEQGIL